MAIIAGVNNSSFRRMKKVIFFKFILFFYSLCCFILTQKKTWAELPQEDSKKFEKMEELMSHNLCFANYRAYLKVYYCYYSLIF